MEAVLAVIDPTGRVRTVRLMAASVRLGRESGCDIVIADGGVSRCHAEIVAESGAHVVRDLGSTNGTCVNGRPIRLARLAHGDRIRVGNSLVLYFQRPEGGCERPPDPLPGTTVASWGEVLTRCEAGGERPGPLERIVGRSPAIQRCKALIAKVAEGDESVLLVGETGTGKELAAEAIHRLSPRAQGPFIPISLPALDENLASAELFGHERGAFTGAVEARRGWLELADGGTAFLDEVCHVPRRVQAKLLRALEEGVIAPVGGRRRVPVDLRVVAATDRDLPAAIEEGRFSAALYYRLATVEIHLSPLRERKEDVAVLAAHFWREARGAAADAEPPWGPDFSAALRAYDWPGNVRELRNAIHYAVRLAGERAPRVEDLPARVLGRTDAQAPTDDIRVLLDRHVRAVLEETGGNRSEAARRLGMTRQGLAKRLKRLGYGRGRKPS